MLFDLFKKLFDFLKTSFSFSISDQKSLKTVFSLKIKSYFLFFVFLICFVFLFFCFRFLFSHTLLKKTLPNYEQLVIEKEILSLDKKIDSLYSDVEFKNYQFNVLKKIISGEVVEDSFAIESDSLLELYKVNKVIEDSILRLKVELEENVNYNYEAKIKNIKNLLFFPPLKGVVSNKFDKNTKHFGIDIVSEKGSFFKSVFSGVVLFVDWGEFGGGSVVVGHPLGITSVYKHASKINCVVGDVVKAGDVLGVIGNSGEYSTGIHLHFEMWLNGEALNPEDFLFY